MASASVKTYGTKVADRVGFDPTIIITIITMIFELLKNCKKPANKSAAAEMIGDEVDAIFHRRRRDKCPLQFRKCFRQEGIRDREEQDELWEAMVIEADADRETVGAMLAA